MKFFLRKAELRIKKIVKFPALLLNTKYNTVQEYVAAIKLTEILENTLAVITEILKTNSFFTWETINTD